MCEHSQLTLVRVADFVLLLVAIKVMNLMMASLLYNIPFFISLKSSVHNSFQFLLPFAVFVLLVSIIFQW